MSSCLTFRRVSSVASLSEAGTQKDRTIEKQRERSNERVSVRERVSKREREIDRDRQRQRQSEKERERHLHDELLCHVVACLLTHQFDCMLYLERVRKGEIEREEASERETDRDTDRDRNIWTDTE